MGSGLVACGTHSTVFSCDLRALAFDLPCYFLFALLRGYSCAMALLLGNKACCCISLGCGDGNSIESANGNHNEIVSGKVKLKNIPN